MSDFAIIGAGGFVGQRLTESLVLSGDRGVRAIVRSYRNLAGLCRFGRLIDIHLADAERSADLGKALDGVSVVVNVTTGAPAGIERSTRAIHDACVRAKVSRLIHLSSAVVYGDVVRPTADDDPPVTAHWMPYARAKAASEVWLRQQMTTSSIDVIVLRPGIVWGVRSPHTMGFARSLSQKNAFVVDAGKGIFNGIYIDNLVAAIRAARDARGARAGFYNVGDSETVTWRTFFEALGRPLGCDVDRLAQVAGDTFPRSLRSTIDTIQAHPLVNDLYHRLKTRIPDAVKTGLKARLEGAYQYERVASGYLSQPSVDRELWHLQKVQHKLPTAKFCGAFGVTPPVSFADGIRKTIAWLDTLGWTEGNRTGDSVDAHAVTTRL